MTGDLGVAVDVYHVWWDPKVLGQIARAAASGCIAFHVCDWLVPTRDMLNDRGMMGDGVIDIRPLRAAVEAAGFRRLLRGRDLLGRMVVEADRRRAEDVHRAVPDDGLDAKNKGGQGDEAFHASGGCGRSAGDVRLSGAKAQAPQKVVLLLNWYLYAEHAPFFLGKERGYFQQEGIDLDIQEGRGSVPTVQAVAAGTAQFGYADFASIAKAADKGAPVEAVGILLQKSPMAFIAPEDKNIKSPQDLKGKTLALTPGDSLSQVLPLVLSKVGLKDGDFTIVSGDNRTKLNAVINGQADAMLGYSMDQNLKIEAAIHKPVRTLPFSDYGVNLASSAIVVSTDTASKNADLVRRFMKAATHAIEDSEKDPGAAVDAMLKASPKAGSREDLVKGLELTIPLYHTDDTKGQKPFAASAANIENSLKLLVDFGGLGQAALGRAKELSTSAFLPN